MSRLWLLSNVSYYSLRDNEIRNQSVVGIKDFIYRGQGSSYGYESTSTDWAWCLFCSRKFKWKVSPQTTAQVMPQNDLYWFVGAEC